MFSRKVLSSLVLAAAVLTLPDLAAHLGGGEPILLRLPVRVYVDSTALTGLTRADFTLWINGEKREIHACLAKEKALEAPRGARDLILAVDAGVEETSLSKGIAAFLDRFVRPEDRIHLLTSSGRHHLGAPPDPAASPDHIMEIIRADNSRFLEKRQAALRHLRDTVDIFIEAASGRKRGVKYTRNHARIMLFLSNFNQQWTAFRDEYLLPDPRLWSDTAIGLVPGGERWMIHLLGPRAIGIESRFARASEVIRTHMERAARDTAQEMTASLARALQTVENTMQAPQAPALQEIARVMAGAEITYLPISSPETGQTADSQNGWSVEFVRVVRDVARFSGGVHTTAADLAGALGSLAAVRDRSYDLVFPFDGLVESKHIRVAASRADAVLFYKNRFLKGEIQILADHLREPEVRITGFAASGSAIRFAVKGFKMETVDGRRSGAVRVKLTLVDEGGRTVYTTQNTLKADRGTVDVALSLPAKHRGYFQLRIEAADLLSRKTVEVKEYVKL